MLNGMIIIIWFRGADLNEIIVDVKKIVQIKKDINNLTDRFIKQQTSKNNINMNPFM